MENRAVVKKEIKYISGGERILKLTRSMWNSLLRHDMKKSKYFSSYISIYTFDRSKAAMLEKAKSGDLKVIVARHDDKNIGHCISTISSDGIGEVESIYVSPQYRGLGIGRVLCERSLKWLDKKNAIVKKTTIISGNDDVIGFYKKFNFFPLSIGLLQAK